MPLTEIHNVLMAIAQNFPSKLNFWERMFEGSTCSFIILGYNFKLLSRFKFVEAIERKQKNYNDAKNLLKYMCLFIKSKTDASSHHEHYINAILEATRQNADEVVKIIVSELPNAIWSTNEHGHNIIQYAVITRSEKVYNLLYQMSGHKNIYKTIKDPFGNNLLHLAARLAPSDKLNHISGAALQIQSELKWFKEVQESAWSLNSIQKNSSGETPQMVFTKEHKELVIEGEKWMKETAQSYTITAALIMTIVFAAAITVPGGNNQDNGIPEFTNKTAFKVFAIADAISLFTSATSLLIFLSILTARFSEQDFLFKLPTKLMIGLTTLFVSTTAMLVAFGATLYLMFCRNNPRMLVPVAALTCLPIACFLTLQFPLIKDLWTNTYGRSIFGKKSYLPF
ncbi:putative PGG domain, ankyrin repeat-containing domain superfamily [Helianthus annuus]|uniref:Ankyrin repeat-containing domain, PGG domain, ankyrin repeat-containing domain superfamily n=1 Tax=Helianthus annuus TaxID=4232 RepID=A0A251UXZ7_HELAN|nr:ankyrin repeat-containing protein ITN1 [Helianthus annuus]XP_035845051.1 ankyrin repeat-containing protein ITN1 [Helianthus annuus]KAF5808973.1 putative ankyrin repeat-containing domain, PGG domain, ankyrin repeat-containing domain superfamily [Helianthus annuus]KAJ0580046.1 putative PGG domain, ankyrin repeat-containing domain superfamily [Helianthus annuus]KAJ0595960.1 putative PGG domain, ankyrin repeat-containing domain superfamily [Helianthus annuus]KAJ0925602.1 putative PGG domain, an